MARKSVLYPSVALSATGRAIIKEIFPLLGEMESNFIELYAGGIGEIETQLFTDGTNDFRIQVRDGALNFDETITPLGFDGVKDTDWKLLYAMKIEI
jgi:hypothetical protein